MSVALDWHEYAAIQRGATLWHHISFPRPSYKAALLLVADVAGIIDRESGVYAGAGHLYECSFTSTLALEAVAGAMAEAVRAGTLRAYSCTNTTVAVLSRHGDDEMWHG
jgi:hypothetical protein